MNDHMTYRDYSALIKFDRECNLFRGEVVGINDLITFHGDSVQALDCAFKDAVDDYLEHCEEIGRIPGKPYPEEEASASTTSQSAKKKAVQYA